MKYLLLHYRSLSLSLIAVLVIGLLFVSPLTAHASTVTDQIQQGVTQAGGDPNSTPTLATEIKTIVNTFLYILGAIAVIMIIVGGIRYVVSAGDAGAVSAAKNTILYAVIGLIVAILAYAIVNYVITAFHG